AERLPANKLEATMREVGRMLAGARRAPPGPLRDRAAAGVAALRELGGSSDIEERGRVMTIRGYSCPLGAATQHHREVWGSVESAASLPVGGAALAATPDRAVAPSPLELVTDCRGVAAAAAHGGSRATALGPGPARRARPEAADPAVRAAGAGGPDSSGHQ